MVSQSENAVMTPGGEEKKEMVCNLVPTSPGLVSGEKAGGFLPDGQCPLYFYSVLESLKTAPEE